MSFPDSTNEAPEPILRELRTYLERVRFHGFFKNLVAVSSYCTSPSTLARRPGLRERADRLVDGSTRGLEIALCLSAHQNIDASGLSPDELRLANGLVDAGFLKEAQGGFEPGSVELIGWNDLYLLLDARGHYPQDNSLHEIYIGADSYLLGYYLDFQRLRRGGRLLDLCMGTGLLGLLGASVGAEVVSTDIAPAPLAMGARNRLLNDFEDRIEIRSESMEETLSKSGESFDVVSCNPPFVTAPEGLEAFPIFAQGPDPDGLGYVRWLFEEVWDVVSDEGICGQVAVFPGSHARMHFVKELEELAGRRSLAIDVYVDHEIPMQAQRDATSAWLTRLRKDVSAEEITSRVTHHFEKVLRAEKFYLSTVVARRARQPEVRVLNRYRPGALMAEVRKARRLDPIYNRFEMTSKEGNRA